MKGAGINWLCYGFESGSEEVLKGVSKKYGDLWDAVKMTREAGINILGNFMFGLPNDTFQTMTQTYELAKDINCEYVNFYCALDYPGSVLYKHKSEDWDAFNQYGKMDIPEWIQSFRDNAFNKYFNRPEYLSMIKEKFGDKAVSHIHEMLGG